jgi:hypothetical protein
MKVGRGFFVHLGLLALAVLAAVGVWTRDKQPKALSQSEVTVWQGRAADVERLVYEAKTKKVTLEAKKDAEGTYYIATVEKEVAAPKKKDDPHGDHDEAEGDDDPDAGAAAPSAPKERTTTMFVSIANAQKLVDQLAPLKAIRGLGKIGDDRAAEFGLAEPEGTLTIKMGGTERKLIFGGATPGGGDRYVRDSASGETYAVKGEIFRSVDGDSTLMERSLHEWADADVTAATIMAQGKSRPIVRGGDERKRFWADPSTPEANDETIGNWTSKLDRLRPTEYVSAAPEGAETVVRVEYTVAGRAGKPGYIELIKAPAPASGGKPEYLIKTERTRLHAKVPTQSAEQVEQDVGAVLK